MVGIFVSPQASILEHNSVYFANAQHPPANYNNAFCKVSPILLANFEIAYRLLNTFCVTFHLTGCSLQLNVQQHSKRVRFGKSLNKWWKLKTNTQWYNYVGGGMITDSKYMGYVKWTEASSKKKALPK